MKQKILCVLFLAMLIAILCMLTSCGCDHSETELQVTSNPTCQMNGWKNRVCLKCGEHLVAGEQIEKLEHNYVLVEEKAPTCDTYLGKGYKQYKCTTCETYNSEEIPALEHQWTEASCTSAKKCTVCGRTEGYILSHDYSTTDGACTVCGFGVKFQLPTMPQTITCYNSRGIEQQCRIEKIEITRKSSYSYSYYELEFLITSTYHINGNNYSDKAIFNWKLYDEDGMVITSGTGYSNGEIQVGEKSKTTIKMYIGNNNDELQDGKTYKLILIDLG